MEVNLATIYDVVIAGAGHNGLVAACYLALAGKRVLVLEKNDTLGGATRSRKIFPGVDARISEYSYLISLLPKKIMTDLGLSLEVRRRATASYTPLEQEGRRAGLLISNVSEAATRESFRALTGGEAEYRRYRALDEKISRFASKVWPTLIEPLRSKEAMRGLFAANEDRAVWEGLVEAPLGALIESHLTDDAVRGAVFTDAKIGVLTYPGDPSLLQNRTFLYHVIGQGTGEWGVPVGGMGALVDALEKRARAAGVTFRLSCEVMRVEPGQKTHTVVFREEGRERAVDARYVLFNASSDVLNRCLPGAYVEEQVEGAAVKINMALRRLPRLKDTRVAADEAFAGTFHINEGYGQMLRSYEEAAAGRLPQTLPGEMYCHSLTDPSILSPELQAQGWQTLTLFGLDAPYRLFVEDNERVKEAALGQYIRAINALLEDDLMDCLALDSEGKPCIQIKSPLDLQHSLSLPRGNIFHGGLSWPFAERDEDAGTWGVETAYANVLVCGSSAARGGAVSGIPGHNAAMKVLEGRGG